MDCGRRYRFGYSGEILSRIFDPFFTPSAGKGRVSASPLRTSSFSKPEATSPSESKLGAGTVFNVLVAALSNRARKATNRGDKVEDSPADETILVVEDDPERSFDDCDVARQVWLSYRFGLERRRGAQARRDLRRRTSIWAQRHCYAAHERRELATTFETGAAEGSKCADEPVTTRLTIPAPKRGHLVSHSADKGFFAAFAKPWTADGNLLRRSGSPISSSVQRKATGTRFRFRVNPI